MIFGYLDRDTAGHLAGAIAAHRAKLVAAGYAVPVGLDRLFEVATAASRQAPPDPLAMVAGWVRLTEAAPLLRLSLSTLRRRVADGALVVRRDGRRVLVHADEVRRYARDQKQSGSLQRTSEARPAA